MALYTLYRVSGDLNRNGEQCGCLYYFKHKELAIRTAKEFNTTVVETIGDESTILSDDWYD